MIAYKQRNCHIEFKSKIKVPNTTTFASISSINIHPNKQKPFAELFKETFEKKKQSKASIKSDSKFTTKRREDPEVLNVNYRKICNQLKVDEDQKNSRNSLSKLKKTKSKRKCSHSSEKGKILQTNKQLKQMPNINPIERQFREVSNRLDHKKHIHLSGDSCFLDYKSLEYILRQMKYVNPKDINTQKIWRLWVLLGGQQYGGFLKDNLLLVLKVLDKYQDSQTEIREQNCSIKLTSDLKIHIKQSEQLKIYVQFKSFVQNKKKSNNQFKDRTAESISSFCPVKYKENLFRQLELNMQKCQQKSFDNSPMHQSSIQIFPLVQKSTNQSNYPQQRSSQFQKPKIPMLTVDVTLTKGRTERIIVYEGNTAQEISRELAQKHKLDEQTRLKFQNILQINIDGLLQRIEEQQSDLLSANERQA